MTDVLLKNGEDRNFSVNGTQSIGYPYGEKEMKLLLLNHPGYKSQFQVDGRCKYCR